MDSVKGRIFSFQKSGSSLCSNLIFNTSKISSCVEVSRAFGVMIEEEGMALRGSFVVNPEGVIKAYEIHDNFLRFWFRFIYPYQSLIERNLFSLLRSNIESNYEGFTGRTLERYFQDKFMETEQFTQIGNWWDRKGENEIDLIAINEFTHTGLIAEIKRNVHKLSMSKLQEKIAILPKKDFGEYEFETIGLSLKDM